MSLPIPSTSNAGNSAPPKLDPRQTQAMDAPLIALTQQCNGDLRQLLFAFFSFLNRRTDFYLVPHPDDVQEGVATTMGFAEGDAEKLLLAAFRQFPLRRIPKGVAARKAGVAKSPASAPSAPKTDQTTSNANTATDKTTTTTTTTTSPSSFTKSEANSTPESSTDAGSIADDPKKKQDVSSSDRDPVELLPSNMKGVEYNGDGLQIPVGNGGSTPRYKWTQTLEETTVLIGIPNNLRGKDFDVSLTASKISVKSIKPLLPGQSTPHVFVEGTLVEKIRPAESTWTVEGGVMILTLDKLQKKFWSTVVEGDEQIDTELVDSRRHISDYDEATQAQLRKIIFDQTQYHKGLPSSDEILGKPSVIPPLPAGVEYIDKKKLDEVEKKK
ncbi:HSP20-like chaperone [Nitzschia inconspicua]|uniref:HSP20-like chaperone n=1 Tax=Nitzschia inconspicua TaxID=303405 RepID=A0A9K3PRJ7_9STRA|nr:HSP20-like chaperone [Nitzschia inconspicua]